MQWVLEIPDAEINRLCSTHGVPRKLLVQAAVDAVNVALSHFEQVSLRPVEYMVPLSDEQAERNLDEYAHQGVREIVAEIAQAKGKLPPERWTDEEG